MEIWRQLIKRITKWNGTKRVKGTTELGDENLFCEALDDEFVIFKRADEDAKLDEWADRKEKEQIELKDSVNISLDEDNDRIIRIKDHMKKYDTKGN